jgi:hypothetical protein
MSKILEHNVETNTISEVEMSKEEIAQRKLDQQETANKVAEKEAKATAKAALLDRLGITADEAALLLS